MIQVKTSIGGIERQILKCYVVSYQVVLGFGHIGIILAQSAFIDLQSTAIVVFHLFILALVLTEQSQVVQLFGHIWVVLPQNLKENRSF